MNLCQLPRISPLRPLRHRLRVDAVPESIQSRHRYRQTKCCTTNGCAFEAMTDSLVAPSSRLPEGGALDCASTTAHSIMVPCPKRGSWGVWISFFTARTRGRRGTSMQILWKLLIESSATSASAAVNALGFGREYPPAPGPSASGSRIQRAASRRARATIHSTFHRAPSAQ